MDVEGALSVGIVALDVPGDGGGRRLTGLLEGDGAGDLGVTPENSNWRRNWSALRTVPNHMDRCQQECNAGTRLGQQDDRPGRDPKVLKSAHTRSSATVDRWIQSRQNTNRNTHTSLDHFGRDSDNILRNIRERWTFLQFSEDASRRERGE